MTKKSLFDNPIIDRKVPQLNGVQRVYRFPNGYGASVVRNKIPKDPALAAVVGIGNMATNILHGQTAGEGYTSYTDNEDEWELAVVKFNGEADDDFSLCYDSGITEDVMGHLEEKDVEKILAKIKKL